MVVVTTQAWQTVFSGLPPRNHEIAGNLIRDLERHESAFRSGGIEGGLFPSS
jgi:hypothetical protein